jgi:SAM-dependent methyltransferase
VPAVDERAEDEAVTAQGGIPRDMAAVRRAVGRHLVGSGIEVGPGEQPFPLAFPGVDVVYLDRWEPDQSRQLFAELGDAPFVMPDVICNLLTDRLGMFDDRSQDFVIASHVLEHVADPIGLLDDIHRVLKVGGIALVLLPDKRRTFDHARPITDLDHLVRDFQSGVTEVDDEHVRSFLQYTDPDYEHTVLGVSDDERSKLFDWHRQRSIHAHVWAEDDFQPVIDYAITELGHDWEFVDGILADDEGPEGIEFGYVMRRSDVALPRPVRAQRFTATREAWAMLRRQVNAQAAALAAAQARAVPQPAPAGAVGSATRAASRAKPYVRRAARAARGMLPSGPHRLRAGP